MISLLSVYKLVCSGVGAISEAACKKLRQKRLGNERGISANGRASEREEK